MPQEYFRTSVQCEHLSRLVPHVSSSEQGLSERLDASFVDDDDLGTVRPPCHVRAADRVVELGRCPDHDHVCPRQVATRSCRTVPLGAVYNAELEVVRPFILERATDAWGAAYNDQALAAILAEACSEAFDRRSVGGSASVFAVTAVGYGHTYSGVWRQVRY